MEIKPFNRKIVKEKHITSISYFNDLPMLYSPIMTVVKIVFGAAGRKNLKDSF